MTNNQVIYFGADGISGYANAAKGYMYDLLQQNSLVYFVPVTGIKNKDKTNFGKYFDKNLKKLPMFGRNEKLKGADVVFHVAPEFWKRITNEYIELIGNSKVIGRTVWDFDKLPDVWVNNINNSIVTVVSVPSEWNRRVFINSGVTKEIIVEPHTVPSIPYNRISFIDTINSAKIFSAKPVNYSQFEKRVKFLNISTLAGRKNISFLIDNYLNTFEFDDETLLVIKRIGTTSDWMQSLIINKIKNKHPAFIYAPIALISDVLDHDQMQSLYDSCDVYVNTSIGEGFNIPCYTAKEKNKKIITPLHGGMVDYLTGYDKLYEVDYSITRGIGSLVDIQSMHTTSAEDGAIKCIAPSYDDLSNVFKTAYYDRVAPTVYFNKIDNLQVHSDLTEQSSLFPIYFKNGWYNENLNSGVWSNGCSELVVGAGVYKLKILIDALKDCKLKISVNNVASKFDLVRGQYLIKIIGEQTKNIRFESDTFTGDLIDRSSDSFFGIKIVDLFVDGGIHNNTSKMIIKDRNFEESVLHKTDAIVKKHNFMNKSEYDNLSVQLKETSNNQKYINPDINISLVSGFYAQENFDPDPSKNGNVSRWTGGSCNISVRDSCNVYNYNITLFNHHGENKFVHIKNKEIDLKFDICVGKNTLSFTTTLSDLELKWDKSFCPKDFNNNNDHRILGTIIENILINGRNVDVVNHLYTQNMRSNFNELVKFEAKEIDGKKIGIIGYISKPDISNANSTFYKHIYSSKSYANVILFSESGWDNTIRVEDPLSVVKKNKDSIGLWTFYKSLIIAKKYGLDYFLMVESDCRFLKNNWDYDLFKTAIEKDIYTYGSLNVSDYDPLNKDLEWLSEIGVCDHDKIDDAVSYEKFPCIVQGNVVGKSPNYIWTNGACSVYKTQAFYDLLNGNVNIILDKWFAWDLDCGKIIVDALGMAEAKKKVVHCEKIASNVATIVTPRFVFNNKHNFVAIHPVKNKWCPPKQDEYKFYHSGDLGDIIYALPAIKTMGGGKLIIGNQCNPTPMFRTREPMTQKLYEFMLPLLNKVDYLKSVSYSDVNHEESDYNFNEFRYYWNDSTYRASHKIDRLIDINLDFVGMAGMFDDTQSWIEVGKIITKKYVVSRSKRYRDDSFPWSEIYQIIKDDCIFVGLDDEHQDFCENIGSIDRIKITDALELAEIINGTKCFIGNNSFPASLAIALNKNAILEYSSRATDCIFDKRINFKTKENYIDMLTSAQ